jgi:hypothetical protein
MSCAIAQGHDFIFSPISLRALVLEVQCSMQKRLLLTLLVEIVRIRLSRVVLHQIMDRAKARVEALAAHLTTHACAGTQNSVISKPVETESFPMHRQVTCRPRDFRLDRTITELTFDMSRRS